MLILTYREKKIKHLILLDLTFLCKLIEDHTYLRKMEYLPISSYIRA